MTSPNREQPLRESKRLAAVLAWAALILLVAVAALEYWPLDGRPAATNVQTPDAHGPLSDPDGSGYGLESSKPIRPGAKMWDGEFELKNYSDDAVLIERVALQRAPGITAVRLLDARIAPHGWRSAEWRHPPKVPSVMAAGYRLRPTPEDEDGVQLYIQIQSADTATSFAKDVDVYYADRDGNQYVESLGLGFFFCTKGLISERDCDRFSTLAATGHPVEYMRLP